MVLPNFFQHLTQLYPQNLELCIEIRPLLPEWRKEHLSEEEICAIHRSVRRWYAITPEYLCNAAKYAEGYRDAFDVYFGVLPRTGRGGGQADVWGAACLFCDVDGGDEGIPGAVERVKRSGVPIPEIAVVSGGGLHCYWILREAVVFETHAERETYKGVLRRLARKIGGESPAPHADLSACECARILRVPGTLNHKRKDEPREVKVIRYAPSESWDYDEWRAFLPMEPIVARKTTKPFASPNIPSDGLLQWANRGYPQGKRHHDLTGAAAWLVRDCQLSESAAISLLQIKAKNSPGVRTITERELENMVRWAKR